MAGQKLDRLLENYLKNAGRNFIYRMLRKKNITLNGKKATGHETLTEGDVVRIWFSDETMEKMTGIPAVKDGAGAAAGSRGAAARGEGAAARGNGGAARGESSAAGSKGSAARSNVAQTYDAYPTTELNILYEDDHVLIVNKPAGMLTQKAQQNDISLNEYAIGYLLESGAMTQELLRVVKPSVCNRLDRNTSGIVCIGKTQTGLRVLSALFKGRTVHKYYHCPVLGRIEEDLILTGYLKRDRSKNVSEISSSSDKDSAPIETRVHPVGVYTDRSGREVTLIEVQLITGRTHQIRAQLSAISHPLIGDPKYGDRALNNEYRKRFGVNSQLLHCARITFPTKEEDPMMEELPLLAGKTIECMEGEPFRTVLESLKEE